MGEAKRLYRSKEDQVFAGIAGGLAEYFEIDPTIMRIIWVLLVFMTGGGALLLYIILIFVIPTR